MLKDRFETLRVGVESPEGRRSDLGRPIGGVPSVSPGPLCVGLRYESPRDKDVDGCSVTTNHCVPHPTLGENVAGRRKKFRPRCKRVVLKEK